MNKTKIELKNLTFFARHGVLDEEATLGQRFRVDVILRLVDGLDFSSDDPACTVNYVEVYKVVEDSFTNHRYSLIEAAAEAIAKSILERFEKVDEVTAIVKKPSVPVDCICDYFSTEVIRCR